METITFREYKPLTLGQAILRAPVRRQPGILRWLWLALATAAVAAVNAHAVVAHAEVPGCGNGDGACHPVQEQGTGLTTAAGARGLPPGSGSMPVAFRPSSAPYGLRGTATGFVVDHEGHVLTSQHGIAGCGALAVRRGNVVLPVRLALADARTDLALLTLRGRLEVAPAVFRRGDVTPGERAVVAGFSREVAGLGWLKVVAGRVVALSGMPANPDLMRLSVAIDPGSSGGPVLDRAGRVIGVAAGTLYGKATGVPVGNPGFAVRAGVVRRFLDSAGVSYATGEGELADIGAQAARAGGYTLLIECHR